MDIDPHAGHRVFCENFTTVAQQPHGVAPSARLPTLVAPGQDATAVVRVRRRVYVNLRGSEGGQSPLGKPDPARPPAAAVVPVGEVQPTHAAVTVETSKSRAEHDFVLQQA